jgi:hypothetical protein
MEASLSSERIGEDVSCNQLSIWSDQFEAWWCESLEAISTSDALSNSIHPASSLHIFCQFLSTECWWSSRGWLSTSWRVPLWYLCTSHYQLSTLLPVLNCIITNVDPHSRFKNQTTQSDDDINHSNDCTFIEMSCISPLWLLEASVRWLDCFDFDIAPIQILEASFRFLDGSGDIAPVWLLEALVRWFRAFWRTKWIGDKEG